MLVVAPAWIGDMVMAHSLLILLRRRHPESPIDVLAPAYVAPLVDFMPEVRDLIHAPWRGGELALAKRYSLGRRLRKSNYARAIVLPNTFKSALTPFFAGIPKRSGFIGEFRRGVLNDARPKRSYARMVEQYTSLADPLGAPTPTSPPPKFSVPTAAIDETRHRLGLLDDRPALGLCPGAAYGGAKRWPARHFADCGQRWISDGGCVWLFGSEQDKSLADAIEAELASGLCRNFCGIADLQTSVKLLAATKAVISNDSGLMHVAAALGRPLVGVFGSTSPDWTPPLGDKAAAVSLRLPCSPCFSRECPLQHHNCLEMLGAEQVMTALAASPR